jgi:hypothetical protein
VNRALSLWARDFSQHFIDAAAVLFTLRLLALSHMGTGLLKLETFA